ncbi:MAG: hypothetical protein VXY93_10045 [Pseudomonadota bacterium]|nr:hypothetical protein [Pseudomonadota bacterium]
MGVEHKQLKRRIANREQRQLGAPLQLGAKRRIFTCDRDQQCNPRHAHTLARHHECIIGKAEIAARQQRKGGFKSLAGKRRVGPDRNFRRWRCGRAALHCGFKIPDDVADNIHRAAVIGSRRFAVRVR